MTNLTDLCLPLPESQQLQKALKKVGISMETVFWWVDGNLLLRDAFPMSVGLEHDISPAPTLQELENLLPCEVELDRQKHEIQYKRFKDNAGILFVYWVYHNSFTDTNRLIATYNLLNWLAENKLIGGKE